MTGSPIYRVQLASDGIYKLHAGSAHGISVGARFTVYSDRGSFQMGSPLGELEVADETHIGLSETMLSSVSGASRFELSNRGIAVQSTAGTVDLRVYIDKTEDSLAVFEALLQQLQSVVPDRYKIAPDESRADAHLGLALQDQGIIIDILDNRARGHGLTRIPFPVDPRSDRIYDVLHAAAHFYRHLDLTITNNYFKNNIGIEFTEIVETNELDDDGNCMVTSFGQNLYQNGIINIAIWHDAKYGLKITNQTRWDLYPYIFLFDNNDLSISNSLISEISYIH